MTNIEALRVSVWYGGDYNPEQWDRTVLDEDMELMRTAAVNTATVGVFSWSSLEPAPGQYRFEWLDSALDLLHAHGIRVILATPTASPPPWFSLRHPEALPVNADGVRLSHGSRDTYNPAAPAYRAAARRITRALAERYGDHPALAMWHLHNEYGTVSYGPVTDVAFRAWLKDRYRSLEQLNHTWNTAFWSQGYGAWDEITALAPTQYLPNPSQVLDFKRFSADQLLECLREQTAIVRELSPGVPITTNFMLPTWNHYDQWAFAREIDVVSIDHYLDDDGPAGEEHVAFAGDLARSFNGGRPWLLMEQSTSLIYDYAGGRMLVKEPGRIRRNTYQYLARGAMGSLFFQWRSPVTGAEFFHSAMVPHSGAESRVFRELAELGRELAALGEVAEHPTDGPVVHARVAIVWSADAWWAAETRALPSSDMAFLPAVREAHSVLWHLGHVVDFVSPDADLSAYDAVLVPSLIPVGDAQAAAFRAFVENGGCLVVSGLAGTTDEHLRVRRGGYCGAFAQTLGIHVEEQVPLREEATLTLSDGSMAGRWSEKLHLRGAEVVATYTSDAHPAIGDGSPAVTRHALGSGTAHYLSTRLMPEALGLHLGRILTDSGVAPENPSAAAGVEIVRRRGGGSTYTFVINHSTQPHRVNLRGVELITGNSMDGDIVVDAGDVRIVREVPPPMPHPGT